MPDRTEEIAGQMSQGLKEAAGFVDGTADKSAFKVHPGSIEETDAASRAVAKNDNRVSLDFIKSQIALEFYLTGQNCADAANLTVSADSRDALKDWPSLSSMTICMLVMRNGFVVIGKSAPLDPANFNAQLGKKFAHEDAVRQCWPLYAFASLEGNFRDPLGAAGAKIFNEIPLPKFGAHKFVHSTVCENDGCGTTLEQVQGGICPRECPSA